jgi:hypothetical protein
MTELLPPADEVRCQLALDLPLQIHGLLELAQISKIDRKRYTDAHVRHRDSVLVHRLEGVVQPAELDQASQESGLDIEALSSRVPSVYAMWVMITALSAQRAAAEVDESVRQQAKS